MKKDYVRLIISDLHLGSANAKESLLCDFLTGIEFDEFQVSLKKQ